MKHVPHERREGVRDCEADRIHRGEVIDCVRESRLICGVACGCVGFGVARGLREVNQARPHQTMEISDPERSRSARKTNDGAITRMYIHCPAIDDLFACLGDRKKSSRDGIQEFGANPVHLVHDASS